jgi:diphosphomevalonate decarboxylase
LNKADVARQLLTGCATSPAKTRGEAFAPSNIALCKYWGKRDDDLNLPMTSSVSISLGDLGTRTALSMAEGADTVTLNGEVLARDSTFALGVSRFLDLVRPHRAAGFRVETVNSIPTAAGLASSASGFAALALALDDLFGWRLDPKRLSILARLGSGSAARSVLKGFVEWRAGDSPDGMDSFAEALPERWPDFRIGLLTVSSRPKAVGSREAMRRTRETSALYHVWPAIVERDLALIKEAVSARDFDRLGRTAESNALNMHATSLGAWPPVLFWLPESVALMHRIWALREDGPAVYFTMDAGPNIKLLFLAAETAVVKSLFPEVHIIAPFG